MSNSSTTEPAVNPPEAGAKKSKKMLLIIILGVVVLGAAGGGGYFYLKRSKADAKETSEKSGAKGDSAEEKGAHGGKSKKKAHEEDDGSEESENEEANDEEETPKKSKNKSAALSLPDDSEVKRVIELQPYIVNLADKGESRYLRITVSVGIGGEEAEGEKPNPLFTTRIRNAMLAVLTTKTSDDVLTTEGKAKLRKELLKAARAASKEPPIQAIYIIECIVQL